MSIIKRDSVSIYVPVGLNITIVKKKCAEK